MFRRLLLERTSGFCRLSDTQLDLLEAHFELMLRWNRTLNLTRVEKTEEAVTRHYGESLFLAARLPAGALRIADLGSGAGFPGIPLAIYRRDCSVTLIESHQRKAVFLKEATRELSNVRVVAKRAEDVIERFDWVVSRAVSWFDLRESALRLAPNLAFLSTYPAASKRDAPTAKSLAPAEVVPFPWDPTRSVVMFHVEHCST